MPASVMRGRSADRRGRVAAAGGPCKRYGASGMGQAVWGNRHGASGRLPPAGVWRMCEPNPFSRKADPCPCRPVCPGHERSAALRLPARFHRPAGAGRRVAPGDRPGLARAGDDAHPPRGHSGGRAGDPVRTAAGRRPRVGHAGAGQPVRHGRTGCAGDRPDAGAVARGRRNARLPAPAGTARRLPRGAGVDPAGAQGAGDEAEDGAQRALPGGRARRRRHRPRPSAGPDLLARRAGAAHHLAARRHPRPGAGDRTHRRLQPRHLPDAGDRPGHDADALAAPIAAAPSSSRAGRRRPRRKSCGRAFRPPP